MQSERTHPVAYALTVARACGELAEEALVGGGLQKPLAAALSAAANSAALRLEAFLNSKGGDLVEELGRDIKHAQADLEAVAQIVGLAVSQDLTRYNSLHVARVARYATDQAAKRLKHVDDALDH
jgi:hypothetical protein